MRQGPGGAVAARRPPGAGRGEEAHADARDGGAERQVAAAVVGGPLGRRRHGRRLGHARPLAAVLALPRPEAVQARAPRGVADVGRLRGAADAGVQGRLLVQQVAGGPSAPFAAQLSRRLLLLLLLLLLGVGPVFAGGGGGGGRVQHHVLAGAADTAVGLAVEEVAQRVPGLQHALFVRSAALVRGLAGLRNHAQLPLLAARLPAVLRRGHGAPPTSAAVAAAAAAVGLKHEGRRGHAHQTTQRRGLRRAGGRGLGRGLRRHLGRGSVERVARALGAEVGQHAHVGHVLHVVVQQDAVVPGVGVRPVRVRALVLVGALRADPVASQKDEDVLAELLGQDDVEERIGARVERVEEDQEDLGVADVDHGEAEGGGKAEEGDGGPADEVGQHQDGHPFGYRGVVAAGHRVAGAHLQMRDKYDDTMRP